MFDANNALVLAHYRVTNSSGHTKMLTTDHFIICGHCRRLNSPLQQEMQRRTWKLLDQMSLLNISLELYRIGLELRDSRSAVHPPSISCATKEDVMPLLRISSKRLISGINRRKSNVIAVSIAGPCLVPSGLVATNQLGMSALGTVQY